MPDIRAPDDKANAKVDYLNGVKYKDLAEKYSVSINTIKSWVKRYGWSKEKTQKGAHKNKRGAPLNNKKSPPLQEPTLMEEIEKLENSNLTDKQRLFCIYYIKYFNATKAYRKAYNSDYTTARTNGCRLLTNTNVQKEINRLKANKLNGVYFGIEELIQKHIDIALADITDYVEFGSKEIITNPAGVLEGEDPIYRNIQYLDINESDEVDGTLISEISQGQYGIKLKLVDKKQSLDFLKNFTGFIDSATKEKLELERQKLELLKRKDSNDDEDYEDDGFIEAIQTSVKDVWSDEE